MIFRTYFFTEFGHGGGCNICDGLLALKVWGYGGQCNGFEGLLRLTMRGQGGGCKGRESVLEKSGSVQDSEYNGFNILFYLTVLGQNDF